MEQIIEYINKRIEHLRNTQGKESIAEKELLKILNMISETQQG